MRRHRIHHLLSIMPVYSVGTEEFVDTLNKNKQGILTFFSATW